MSVNNKQNESEEKSVLDKKELALVLPNETFEQLLDLKKLYRSPSMSHTIRLAIEDMLKIMKKKAKEEEEERTLG